MRQRDCEKIIANYQDVMETQVERIEQLKRENQRLSLQLSQKPDEVKTALDVEAIVRLKTEALLFLRTLDELCPTMPEGLNLPQNDYYLELSRLTKPTAATMSDRELDLLIEQIGGIE